MHTHLTIEQAQKFYPGQVLNWPISTREAHSLLNAMGLQYDPGHLAEFASDSGLRLERGSGIGRACVWTQADVESVAAQLARLGHLTMWAAGWRAFGVPLATAETARAAACAAYGADSWKRFDITISGAHAPTAAVFFSPRREVEQ